MPVAGSVLDAGQASSYYAHQMRNLSVCQQLESGFHKRDPLLEIPTGRVSLGGLLRKLSLRLSHRVVRVDSLSYNF